MNYVKQQTEDETKTMERVQEELVGLHPHIPLCVADSCESCDYKIKASLSMQRLQIDLNSMCTLGCHNCDRHIDIAPGDVEQNITLEQIEKMINESIDIDYKWDSMIILGGEPTIHPQFREIVSTIVSYRNNYNKDMKIRMASNGYTLKTREELSWVKDNFPDIFVANTSKTSNIQGDFVNVRNAPKDRYPEGTHFERCPMPCHGGIGFNYSGFYGCATGAATAKIFGYDIGIRNMKDLTYKNLEKVFDILCPLCGHWDCVEFSEDINNEPKLSKSWINALERYKENGVSGITRY